MTAPTDSVPLTLALRYDHPHGALTPYFRGLESGQAVAAQCPVCKRIWFPPHLICPHDRHETVWTELSGAGRIVSVSIASTVLPFNLERRRYAFGLIALDGAENAAFGRIAGDPEAPRAGMGVRLARAPGAWPHPAQCAWFVLGERPHAIDARGEERLA